MSIPIGIIVCILAAIAILGSVLEVIHNISKLNSIINNCRSQKDSEDLRDQMAFVFYKILMVISILSLVCAWISLVL